MIKAFLEIHASRTQQAIDKHPSLTGNLNRQHFNIIQYIKKYLFSQFLTNSDTGNDDSNIRLAFFSLFVIVKIKIQ